MKQSEKIVVSATVGVAAGVVSSMAAIGMVFTAPVSVPLLGGLMCFCAAKGAGASTAVAAACVPVGMAVSVPFIPLAPLSLITWPLSGLFNGVNAAVQMHKFMDRNY